MASIANKDEAYNCLQLGTKYLRAGDTDKALKYLYKSQRLFPTTEVETLIDTITKSKQNESQQANHTSSSSSSSNTTQSTSTSHTSTQSSNSTQSNATTDDITLIQQIKAAKTHYECLGLQKTCTEKEIKIAYRKLAVKVHPDKNKTPGAEEAFKLVSNSYSILSDTTKRKQYDMFGDTATDSSARYSQPTRNAFYTDINDDISPEDIFRMFFNGQFGQPNARPRTYRRTNYAYNTHTHYTHQNTPSGQGFTLQQLVHFLPILLLVLFSWFSMSHSDDTPYSIHRTPAMPIPRTTHKYETPYYVDRSFMQRYGRDTRAIYTVDNMVEQSWLKYYDQQCTQDKQQYTEKLKHARNSNMSGEKYTELLQQVNEMRFDSCEKLAEQYNKI